MLTTRGSLRGTSNPTAAASIGRAWGRLLPSVLIHDSCPSGQSASAPSASADKTAPRPPKLRVAPSPSSSPLTPSPPWSSSSGSRPSPRGLTLRAHAACLLPLHPHPPPLTLSVASLATVSILGVPGATPPSPSWSSWGRPCSPRSSRVSPRPFLRAMTRLLRLSILSLARAALSLASASRNSLRPASSTRLHSSWNSSASRVPVKTIRVSTAGATIAYGPERSLSPISSSLPRLSVPSPTSPNSMRLSFSLSQM